MLKRFRRDGKGFTLIELLIVVAIIGVLAAIAIPNLLSAQKRAKVSRALADAKTIVSQTQLYYNDNNAYPTLALLMGGTFMPTVYDPFGTATQNYGFGNPGITATDPVWALSVGPAGGTTPPSAAHTDGTAGTCTGTGTATEVGYQTDYGAITVTGC